MQAMLWILSTLSVGYNPIPPPPPHPNKYGLDSTQGHSSNERVRDSVIEGYPVIN